MEWSTVMFLGMSMVSLVLVMGIIIFGTRKSSEMKEFEKQLGEKARHFNSNASELREALQKSEEEKEKMLQRLQNLEAIVTSEAWEAITNGEEDEKIQLHLDDEESQELDDADKVARLAKRVR